MSAAFISTVPSMAAEIGSLPNSLQVQVEESGQVRVSIVPLEPQQQKQQEQRQRLPDQRFPPMTKKPRLDDEKAGTTTTTLPTTDKNSVEPPIPESVLQYERQWRKVQAKQRSLAELSMDKHLNIVYEDDDLILVNKPSGVLCVPGLYNKPNLLQLVCQYLKRTKTKSEMIVHRLDMDTSGLVLFSKSDVALKKLHAAFRDRQVEKEYHALLCGHLPTAWEHGNIHLPLQRDHKYPPFMRVATPRSEYEASQAVQDLCTHGFKQLIKKKPKPSHTEFRILQREYLEFPNSPATADEGIESQDVTSSSNAKGTTQRIPVTRVALTPHTGRTHQLRVHCAALGYPIVGDPAYGIYGEADARGGLDSDSILFDENTIIGAPIALQQTLNTLRPPGDHTMCLHAAKLGLQHPISGVALLWMAKAPF